ncbi:MAG: small multidrug resistance family (SMR) protein [uncultured Thermoleophilia bacterium]|uniref:Small multidrug resistance family (SMR) protein n=1 Tax=uncultured Thermoleophilia bacterium TaxID=1497501 RepID=A0A6J4U1D8_9ACTN|nr:MAG: small multidrug resistance family (SMR) protein [uncultured Thermoleophilia bacterium]
MNAWLLLSVAIAAEIVGTLALRASDGFTRLLPSSLVVVGYGISFVLLAQVLKTMSVGIVYAIWSAVGIAAIAVLGRILFDDPLPPLAAVGILVIIVGVGLLQLSGAGHR